MELTLSINQIAKVIAANGADKTYIVEGPMGSGKSSIPKIVETMYGDKYNYITVTSWCSVGVRALHITVSARYAEVIIF